MGIGSILQDLIKARGTNVNELSSKINVSPSTIYSIIRRDNMKVDFDILIKICDELNVDVEYFYNRHTKKNTSALSMKEQNVIKKYRSLNENGKHKVDEYLNDISSMVKYITKDSDMETALEIMDLAEQDANEILKNEHKT